VTRAELRRRVLKLLDECDAGQPSGNWRDSSPAYWIGVAEGEAAAESKRGPAPPPK
jgi:hypothetical protein